jgi:hypothetical protein
VTEATCDDGGVADNVNETATGPDQDTAGGDSAAPERKSAGRGRSGGGRSGMRDMLLSMIVLAIGVLVLAGITKGCSFSPGGPSTDASAVPTVDATAELQAAAGQVKFPLRQPQLPAGWRPNSDAVDSLGPHGNNQAVRIGWITPSGAFLQVSQSDASTADLVRAASGADNATPVRPIGTEVVSGTKWTVYRGIRAESSWVLDQGVERVFITGNGTKAEFRTLATATTTGPKVAPTGGP